MTIETLKIYDSEDNEFDEEFIISLENNNIIFQNEFDKIKNKIIEKGGNIINEDILNKMIKKGFISSYIRFDFNIKIIN